MIHAYHATFGTYGSWLPNDPRGSASAFVGSKKLFSRGHKPDKSQRLRFEQLNEYERRTRSELQSRLNHKPITLSAQQLVQVAAAIGHYVATTRLQIWAAAIMPCHVHLVFARCGRKAETVVDEIMGACDESVRSEGMIADGPNSLKSIWANGRWIEYPDSEERIEAAIDYVYQNPMADGLGPQAWPFVVAFRGVERNITSYND